MSKKRILYLTQELNPYVDGTAIGKLVRELALHTHGKNDFEVRMLMPRFGNINERRHKLHEVVRLSGINIIIDDDDYPLIIKVASMPSARMQVYFLDNDDFFGRKQALTDKEGKMFDDNAERAVFYNKGSLETVKKFGWAPDVVHCHGWMTSFVPMMLKTAYKNDPIFENSKVVYSVYKNDFDGQLADNFIDKAMVNRVERSDLDPYGQATNTDLHLGAIHYADAVVKAEDGLDEAVVSALEADLDKPQLTAPAPDEEKAFDAYTDFYAMLLEE